MPGQLNYDLTVMGEAASKLKQLKNDLIVLKGKLGEIPSQAESFWIGPAERAFLDRSREMIKNTNQYCEDIGKTEAVLTEAIQFYRQQENQQVTQVNQLNPNDVF